MQGGPLPHEARTGGRRRCPFQSDMDQTAYCTIFAEILQTHKRAHATAEQAIDLQNGLAVQWREATLSEFV